MERPAPSLSKGDKPAFKNRNVSKVRFDKSEKSRDVPAFDGIIVHQILAIRSDHETSEPDCDLNCSHSDDAPLEDSGPPGFGMIDSLKARALRVTDQLHPQEKFLSHEDKNIKPIQHQLDQDFASVFKGIEFSILVKPEIAGANIPTKSSFNQQHQLTVVDGEIGQKFANMSEGEIVEDGLVIAGLYNFARLPGSFEDLIELPGNTTTTVVGLRDNSLDSQLIVTISGTDTVRRWQGLNS